MAEFPEAVEVEAGGSLAHDLATHLVVLWFQSRFPQPMLQEISEQARDGIHGMNKLYKLRYGLVLNACFLERVTHT